MNNDYKVSKYVICYFDILGYKQTLQELGDSGYIHYIVCVMDTIKDVLNSNGMIPFEYHIFSDNIIIFVPITEDKYKNTLSISEFIRCISLLQRNLIGQYSIFIRGCILIGDLYYDGNFIFGSGLIKAYSLENEIAIYPRIILDAECVNLCCGEGEMHWDIIEKRYMRKDEDGYFFLDYLSGLKQDEINILNRRIDLQRDPIDTSEYTKLPDPFTKLDFSNNENIQRLFTKYHIGYSLIGLSYLLLHKIIIERNIAIAKNEKIRKKYVWCKNYHNEVCKTNNIPELIIK